MRSQTEDLSCDPLEYTREIFSTIQSEVAWMKGLGMVGRMKSRQLGGALAAALALVIAGGPAPTDVAAQVRPIYDNGASGLLQSLERLQTTASAMHTGAHPDDENSELIARLARGDHARVAYLSLNRGEGGQNVIGIELADALGVIRTEELLQARRLDGGDQLFTRAFDFGFTTSMQESLDRWGADRILGDMVRAIRLYRPLVIISRFSGTPADGHGQHQVAGYLTPMAFKAAGDPAQFPEQVAEGLRPWQPRKLYVGEQVEPSGDRSVSIETGQRDPVLGRTYSEIAMEGRSQHKSQEMGGIELRGPRTSRVRLVEMINGSPRDRETSIFDGLETSLGSIDRLAELPPIEALRNELATMEREAARALELFDPRHPTVVIPPLAAGLSATRKARALFSGGATSASAGALFDADFLLAQKEHEFAKALERAAGIDVDALASVETIARGESFTLSLRAYVPDASVATLGRPTLVLPEGWTSEPIAEAPPPTQSPFARFFQERPTARQDFHVSTPRTAPITQPYWLATPREGDVVTWANGVAKNLPFSPATARCEWPVEIGGVSVTLERPVEYRYANSIRGELRRELNVVPTVTVALDPSLMIVPLESGPQPRRLSVRVQRFSQKPVQGVVRLGLPSGWISEPTEESFNLDQNNDRAAVAFQVTPPTHLTPGAVSLSAQAVIEGEPFGQSLQTVAYPHIQTHRLYRDASATLRVIDLKVAPVTVGYIMGSGDLVPDALRRMGVDVTLLDDEALAVGDLSSFDTIVVGIRASEARPAFAANMPRLIAYVNNGGTLVMQYQQTDFVARALAPFPAQMATRVTDERAPVRVLAPDHPVFNFPNRITAEDWEGWVQERYLYGFSTFDERYTPLLETWDPGGSPQRGGEVYAKIGKGHFIYTAYAWFRQLPAGVPGAYRLFANLISLPKAPR